jgi:tetratricopeptide (TPR) repeat protein
MSLIIDALRRAQQLRLEGAEGPPILDYPYPKKRGRRSKKQWIPVGAGLISLCIVLLVFLRPTSTPLATQTSRAIVPIERKSPVPVAEKVSSEPPEKVLSLPKDENSLPTGQALNSAGSEEAVNRTGRDQTPNQAGTHESPNAGTAASGSSSHSPREKKSAETKTSFVGKKGESSSKQASPSLPMAAQKKEPPLKSIGVEQEGTKSGMLASEVLNHFNSGVTFYNQKEFSKAIQAYQKVIELDPTYVEAYNNLGITYQTTGDLDRAFGAYQKATEINPGYEKGYNNLGILLLLEGRDEEALEAFQKALAINPNNIVSHIHLGILLKNKGQWDEAIESYQKALAIDPLHRETHYNIALLYEQLGKLELAISHYQEFIRLSSKSHPDLVSRVRRHLSDLVKGRDR